MDPITMAIVAGLSAGLLSDLTDASKQMITGAYTELKTLLTKKFGNSSEVVKSIENLEIKPSSPSRQGTLQEEIQAAHADQDAELLEAAQILLNQIKAQPGGEYHLQNAIGNYVAQSDRSSNAIVNVNLKERNADG